MVSVDPLEELGLLLERPDPSHFWRGIDASLADKWSSGSRTSLFPPLRDRLNLFGPAPLPLGEELDSRCVVEQVTWQNSFGSID